MRITMVQIHDEKVPLSTGDDGIIYIAGTRVSLDCLVEMFEEGASPEEIVEQYDALLLADVYAVITYLLRNPDEVNAYLSRPDIVAAKTRQVIAEQFPRSLRSKLLKAQRTPESG